jgi:hypothetical protein
MVAAVRGETFVEVTEALQRDSQYYRGYEIGEMATAKGEIDGDTAHYYALDEVMKWLGFSGYEDYAEALETEGPKIFERGK